MLKKNILGQDGLYGKYNDNYKESYCMNCHEPGVKVSHVLRVPTQSDGKGWEMLNKILDLEVFENYPKKSIGWHWYHAGGLGCALHFPDHIRTQMWVPTQNYEYQDWLDAFKKPLIW